MLGNVLIYVLVCTTFATTLFYFLSIRNDNIKTYARYFYFLSTGIIVFVSGYFLANILNHNYSITYIFSYSNNNLPLHLLISSFFAGQEGSFLLWALFAAIIGIIIIPQCKKYNIESQVMGFYSLIFLFLIIMLIAKSPFRYIWDTYPTEIMEDGIMPIDGKGMNPILENFWMVIHPPILFIGYATMTVPFVFALSGLIRKDYSNWLKPAYYWALVSSGVLGLGIMLGGFWAYETLGWGGFWGWDPVENSSLLPWITVNAFIHTILVQKRTGGLIKVNFSLAIISYILVIYATFLTRSGILGDTSVHSFMDPGIFVYFLLLIFLLLFFLLGFGLLFYRTKNINQYVIENIGIKKNKEVYDEGFNLSSKEYFISIGTIFLLASVSIIYIGTNFPIFSELLGREKSSVDISFYNKWNLPIVFGILIINGFALLTNWKKTGFKKILWKVLVSAVLSFILVLILSYLGLTEIKFQVLAYSIIFSLIINIEYFIRNFSFNITKYGSFISHIGFALLILGVIFNATFSESKTLELELNNPVGALGYTFEFTTKTQIDNHRSDQEKYEYNVTIKDKASEFQSYPVIYWSSFNNYKSPFFEPGIVGGLQKDFYLEPKTIDFNEFGKDLLVNRDEVITVPHDNQLSIKLIGMDMSQMQATSNQNHIILGAIVEITTNRVYTDTLYSIIDPEKKNNTVAWEKIPDKDYHIGFKEISISDDISKSNITLGFAHEVFICHVSIESYMSLVWIGSLMAIIGFFLPLFNRKRN